MPKPRLLFLADGFDPVGPARLAVRLAAALPSHDIVAVDLAGRGSPTLLEELRRAGVPCLSTPVRFPLDGRGLRDLFRICREIAPDVVHALGSKATTAAAILRRIGTGPAFAVVASSADEPRTGFGAWLFRRVAGQVDRFVAANEVSEQRLRGLGVRPDQLTTIAPGVAPFVGGRSGLDPRGELKIPPAARIVVAPADFTQFRGSKSAVWAFDIVKYVVPDLHLVLVGDGPTRERAERFALALGFDDYRVHFVAPRADLDGLISLAELVWVTDERGGTDFALRAMAGGKPVVAFDAPELRGILTDRVTGRIVPRDDRVKLASATAELLDDPAAAAQLGEAGRAWAASHFPLAAMAASYAALYDGVVRASPRTPKLDE